MQKKEKSFSQKLEITINYALDTEIYFGYRR